MSSSSEVLDALGALEPLPDDFWAWPVPGWLTGAEEAALYALGRRGLGGRLSDRHCQPGVLRSRP